MSEPDIYHAVMPNEVISSHSWDDIPKTDDVTIYLKGAYHHHHITAGGNYIRWNEYTIINKEKKEAIIEMYGFRVKKIHNDNGLSNFLSRRIEIIDMQTCKSQTITINKKEFHDSYNYLLSFYPTLREALKELRDKKRLQENIYKRTLKGLWQRLLYRKINNN